MNTDFERMQFPGKNNNGLNEISDNEVYSEIVAKIKIEKQLDEELTKMVRDNPIDFIMAMLIKMGQICVEANAETMDLKQKSTLDNQRYEIKCKITVKKVKK